MAALTAIIEPEARALGFDLVRVRIFGGDDTTLQVMAERPDTGQLNIDDCSALSHRISDALDLLEAQGRDPMDSAYRLEVSSPGIDRPLTRAKDFNAWIGHEARITLGEAINGQKQFRGDLAGYEESTGLVHLDMRKVGKASVPFDQIVEAKLALTNRLIAATRPLDTSGADEFDEISTDDLSDNDSDQEDHD
jgi:ribosome maturation factor RimP